MSKTAIDKIRGSHPVLWENFRKEMNEEVLSFIRTNPPMDATAIDKMERTQDRCMAKLADKASELPSYTSVCVHLGDGLSGCVVFHEKPIHTKLNKCCVHLGTCHLFDESAVDLWCCTKSNALHVVTNEDVHSVDIGHVDRVNGMLGFAFRIANRVVTKRPELLAKEDRRYAN